MNPGSEAEKRNESVIKCREVTPQVNQSVFSRSDFLQQLLLGQVSKELARAINGRPPIPKCRVYERSFKSHILPFRDLKIAISETLILTLQDPIAVIALLPEVRLTCRAVTDAVPARD
jgi:hypothetical protein